MTTTTEIATDWPGRLRAARLAAGWTTRDLTEASGVSSSTINQIEHGYQGSPKSRDKIAAALGFESTADLFPPARPLPAN